MLDERGERITDGLKTVEQGAATIVFAAVDERLSDHNGTYLEEADVAQLVETDGHVPSGVRRWAVDSDLAEQLWKLSERAAGAATLRTQAG